MTLLWRRNGTSRLSLRTILKPTIGDKYKGFKMEPAADHQPSIKVLVVDDEPLILMNTADMIAEAGYQVFEARNADEAIRILDANPEIRLLFTDIEMPGSMDGIKLAQYASHRWPPLKIIIVSGKSSVVEAELPEHCLFLPKPFWPSQVMSALSHCLR
jgi:two-component system, response regulator PdtaR